MDASAPAMDLRVLLDAPAAPSLEISGLCEDSRQVRPGDAFIAVKGDAADGHAYAAAAVERGALCVLAERPLPTLSVPVVEVADLPARRGALADRFYRRPSHRLTCVGVTGTNGKTSIVHHLAGLGQGLGLPAGYLGTLGWGELGALAPSRLTTEGAVNNHKRLACLGHRGCRWAAMEVSSHALAQGRVADIDFDYAVFSNLSRDHLDYHRSLAEYGAAKRRLFEFPSLRAALINIDDDFGRALAASLPNLEVITYGRRDADLCWQEVEQLDAGLRCRLYTPWGTAKVEAPVCGSFGVANLAAAIGVLTAAGQPLDAIAAAAQDLPSVPGRMEFLRRPGRPTVVVDYAHTPDALAKALAAAGGHCRGRLHCVVGCGGDRDRGKRPLMAQAAVAGADLVWLTSDNPRSEDPAAIIADMAAGLPDRSAVVEEADRAAAIAAAIDGAQAADLILVAGKGHEDYQEIEGRRLPFDDRRLVRQLLGIEEEAH